MEARGLVNKKIARKKTIPTAIQPVKQKLVIFLIFSLLPSPRAIETEVVPPFPNRVPIPERIVNIGILREIAAILLGSPV